MNDDDKDLTGDEIDPELAGEIIEDEEEVDTDEVV